MFRNELGGRRHGARLVVVAVMALMLGAMAARPAAAAGDGRRGKTAGVTFSYKASGDQQVRNLDLGRIKSAGADTVSIVVWWQVVGDNVLPGSDTMSDVDLANSITAARNQGLKVVLNPLLHCQDCTGGWRGAIHPTDAAAFYDSYRSMVNHFADLAESGGVSLMLVGSEMTSLDSDTAQWREVVRQARQHFHGRLAYGANFDRLGAVHFWDAVDVIGVSAYYPLSDAASPSVAELKAAWHGATAASVRGRRWFEELSAQARLSGRPIMFTEAGYRSISHVAHAPYDYAVSDTADNAAQANAYQALLETFENEAWWAGTLWWGWDSVSSNATSYSPRGKTAEQLLTRWWAEGWRPGTATAPAAPGRAGTSHPAPTTATRRATAARPAASGAVVRPAVRGAAAAAPTSADGATLDIVTAEGGPSSGPSARPLTTSPAGQRGAAPAVGAMAFLALAGVASAVIRQRLAGVARRLRPALA